MGEEISTLATSTDIIIKAIDPNKTGNVGLCNHQKIRMRQYSSVVNFIIRNHLIQSSYTYQNPKKYLFTYKDEVSVREVSCGLIKLWLCLNVVGSQLVVDYWVQNKSKISRSSVATTT